MIRFCNCCRWSFLSLILLMMFGVSCGEAKTNRTSDGRIIIDYWETWTGFEGDAMRAVVDDFNASQNEVFVRMLSTSQIDQKLMLATAGGNPPDVAGLNSIQVSSFAEKGARSPLDGRLAASGLAMDRYLLALAEVCEHRGFVWAMPTTPATTALHWNRRLFVEAGLDPDVPPRSIAELDAMIERLTVVEIERDGERVEVRYDELSAAEKERRDFDLVQLGFSPNEPGWWTWSWGLYFGGELWDEDRRVTANAAANVRAFEWQGNFARKFGEANMKQFGASFGNFASPQNPFMDGRIAMVIQGVWMFNFIDTYAPGLDWAAAPFPTENPDERSEVTVIECNVLVIPRGSRNPEAAWAFIEYVSQQGPMEKLCMGHRKFSPLRDVSADFVTSHPNPNIQVFIDLAGSPNALSTPEMVIWTEYNDELSVAADRIFSGTANAEQAMNDVVERMQWKFDRALRRWDLTGEARAKAWADEVDSLRALVPSEESP